MGKVATRLRSVTYTLSPMRTGVMHGLFKDWAAGMAKRVKENAVDAGLFCAVPLFGTMAYVTRRDATRRDSTITRVWLFVMDGWIARSVTGIAAETNIRFAGCDGRMDRARVSRRKKKTRTKTDENETPDVVARI